MMFVIYGLVHPGTDNIFYVGRTTRPWPRLRQHRLDGRASAPIPEHVHLGDSKNTHVRKDFENGTPTEMRVLEIVEGTRDDAQKAEESWIRKLRSEGYALTNKAPYWTEPPIDINTTEPIPVPEYIQQFINMAKR